MITKIELLNLHISERIDLSESTTDPKILTDLGADSNKYVRGNVADNPNTPADTLTALATDADDNIRRFVAANPNTPADTLTVLATAADDHTRGCVATNPAASNELLWCLLIDNYKDVTDHVTIRLQIQNLSLAEPNWANPETLKTIYDTLQTNNILNSAMLTQLLKADTPLTQMELIATCGLHDENIRDIIKTHYSLIHPLLIQTFKPTPKHTPTLATAPHR